ncbi:MAG: RagB/SusD family nutrient uptake outer membrane protein [Bacteroidetes bacterium]|nr:RagB/SusD family nutrient uptake outer membrane protein [Bacteroidota bacterium]
MKTIKYLFLALSVLSCNVLDQVSPNDVADGSVFDSEDGANAALIGLYSSMQSRDYYGGYYPLVADLYSDIGTAGGFDNVALDEINILDVTTANIITENIWLSIYGTIAGANAIVERVGLVSDPGFTQTEKDHIKGQALAIRALAHFDLLRMFGEHWNSSSAFGIPVVTKIQKASDVVARSGVSAVYDAILADLTAAATLVDGDERSTEFMNVVAIKALASRVQLYRGNKTAAASLATEVIEDGQYELLDAGSIEKIYTSPYRASESLFELTFDIQNRSAYNAATFSRTNALRTEVLFLAENSLNSFFADRPGDVRSEFLDFENNDESILPDGRSLKYRGEETRDNPAYIIRLAEVYLIRAEAKGLAGGLADLNAVRTSRGLEELKSSDLGGAEEFIDALLDERKAELNFEGSRMFDLARTGRSTDVLGIEAYQRIFPIPLREIIATRGVIKQNPGYPD